VDHYGVVPDMVSMAKGINSGILPFGAVGFSNKIFDALAKSNKRLMSYTTSDGNAVVAATALAALKICAGGPEDIQRGEDGRPGGQAGCSAQ